MIIFKMLLCFFPLFLSASIIDDYKNKKYFDICKFDKIVKYKKNEKFLSIIGTACVKSNKLFLLPYIVNYLKHTKAGRQNAIYFLVIFSEKKLLYAYLFDNFDISMFSFPKTDYILSDIFDAIKNKKFVKKDNIYIIKEKNATIKFYKEDDKMIIEKNGKRCWFR
jgi:hypothetical protein